MRLTALQPQESDEDPNWTMQVEWVATAQLGRQEIQSQVMTANGNNGGVKTLRRPQQLTVDFLASIEAPGEAWNNHQAIGAYQ